jgi:hypothetical protein
MDARFDDQLGTKGVYVDKTDVEDLWSAVSAKVDEELFS